MTIGCILASVAYWAFRPLGVIMTIEILIVRDGEVVETIEDVEGYNLDMPVACGVLTSEIIEAVQRIQAEVAI